MTGEDRYLPDDLPLPSVDDFTRAFLTSGTLAIQRCAECGHEQHPPVEICTSCGGVGFDYPAVSARGTISSFTVIHHATHRALVGAVPYNVVIVELDERPQIRIVGNLLDAELGDLAIGQRVVGSLTKPLTGTGEPEPVRLLQWRVDRGPDTSTSA